MKYKLPKDYCNAAWMTRNRFQYSAKFSSSEENVYIKKFSVWKYGDTITLAARVLVTLETGDVQVDVLETGFQGLYAPYYLRQSYYSSMMETIDKRIKNELERCNIVEVNEDVEV